MIAPGTDYYNKLHGDATSLVKYETWQKICVEFCHESGQPFVNHQKLRDMYKKDIAKGNKEKRKEYTQLVAEEREYQIYSKGTDGGPAAPALQQHDNRETIMNNIQPFRLLVYRFPF